MPSQPEPDYAPDEAQRRFEQALKAAVTTPPVPMKDRLQDEVLAGQQPSKKAHASKRQDGDQAR